jgi:hypothetical protein
LGDGDGPRRVTPNPSPGTPRHPSYPSGHSTYAGAASELLSWFFPDYREELNRLADNAGMARLWAGIHYRSDHIQGRRLGRTVACLVIDQLSRSHIPRTPDECVVSCPGARLPPNGPCDPPPAPDDIDDARNARDECCVPEEATVGEEEQEIAPEAEVPPTEPGRARTPQRGARGISGGPSAVQSRSPQRGAR